MKHALFIIMLVAGITTLALAQPTTSPRDTSGTRVIYVVRHAEKASGPDPVLSEQGHTRADRLAQMLKHEPLGAVFVTDTNRSRLTGSPSSQTHAIETTTYPATDPHALRSMIDALPHDSNALVIAHSNTVSMILESLGAQSVGDLPEDEYTRVFAVVLRDGSHVRTLKLSY